MGRNNPFRVEDKGSSLPLTQLMLLGRKGSSVAFSVLGPLGSFTRLEIPLFLTLSDGATISLAA